MMVMRWWNWVGVAMLVIMFIAKEPIWSFVSLDLKQILLVGTYVSIAAVLLILEGPDRDKP